MSTRARGTTAPEVVVGIAELAVVQGHEQVLVTHALGSCIGLTVFDPVAAVGGLLHYLLDHPLEGRAGGADAEAMFATTGIPTLFREAYRLGASRERIIACAAGGSEMLSGTAGLRIGARNRRILARIFSKNRLSLRAEDTGGCDARTLRLDMRAGQVEVQCRDSRRVLWAP